MNKVNNLTQAYSQAPWRRQVQIVVLFSLGLIFIALIAGIYLNVTARTATMGRKILINRNNIDELTNSIADLQTQLANITSSTEMENRAIEAGFKPVEKGQQIYIAVTGYTEKSQAVLAPPPSPVKAVPASLPPNFTESLFDWLQKKVIPQISTKLLGVQP